MKKTILLLAICSLLTAGLLPDVQKVVRVTSELANIRQQASTTSPILLAVKKDTLLKLLGKNGNWLRVETPDGRSSGYIHNSLVVIEDARKDLGPQDQAAPKPPAEKIPRGEKPLAFQKSAKDRKFYLTGSYSMSMLEETKNVGLAATIYYEDSGFSTEYQADKGSGFSLALGYRISPALSLEIGADVCSRDLGTTTAYSIPHPLWVGNPRSGETSRSGTMSENTVFLNIAYSLEMRPLFLQLSAGPCLVMAKADIIDDFNFSEGAYPFSSVSVTPVIIQEKKNVFGFNAGAAVGYRFSPSISVLAGIRYISAKLSLTGDGEDLTYPGELTLGGLKLGGGLQFSF